MASRAKMNQNLIGKKANCEQKKEPRRQENSPNSCCMGGGSKEATGGEANHEGGGECGIKGQKYRNLVGKEVTGEQKKMTWKRRKLTCMTL